MFFSPWYVANAGGIPAAASDDFPASLIERQLSFSLARAAKSGQWVCGKDVRGVGCMGQESVANKVTVTGTVVCLSICLSAWSSESINTSQKCESHWPTIPLSASGENKQRLGRVKAVGPSSELPLYLCFSQIILNSVTSQDFSWVP